MTALIAEPFAELEYSRVDYEYLANQLRRARLRLRLAMSAEASSHAIAEMQASLRLYETQSALARIRHDLQTDDQFYAAEQDYYDQADARVTQLLRSFYSNLQSSRFKPELEEQYGSLIFRKAKNLKEIVNSAVVNDLAEENRLESTFMLTMSSALVQYNGQTLTLAQLEPMLQSPIQQIRQLSHQILQQWHQDHADELDQIFSQLVVLRHRIGQKLGLRSFTDLGYKRMERFDYTRAEIENLRRAVIRYIVPLTHEIRRLQRRRLGLEKLYYDDLPCLFPAGNPRVLPTVAEYPQVAAQLFAALTKQQPSFFQPLIDGGYLDLESRNNKMPGGYCSTIINANSVFILMNASGTAQDVSTLLHEAGHAYAGLRSLQDVTLLEYQSPSMETCEIHSTAMEYLCYPLMDRFFGAEAENFTLMHMIETLLFIPYGCMVDEFQHIVYDQPNLTPDERHQVWRDLEKIYQPDINYRDAPFFERGGAWHKKEHIFTAPFYYIDYVLAQLVALDIWRTSRKAPDKAWRSYDKLCSLAGRDSFRGLLEKAGLSSPFDSDTIKRVAYAACDFIDL